MEMLLLAYCPQCAEVREHAVVDPGACACLRCGASQNIVRPLAA